MSEWIINGIIVGSDPFVKKVVAMGKVPNADNM